MTDSLKLIRAVVQKWDATTGLPEKSGSYDRVATTGVPDEPPGPPDPRERDRDPDDENVPATPPTEPPPVPVQDPPAEPGPQVPQIV